MKIRLQEKYFMRNKVQRDVLPWKANSFRVDMCAPPSYKYLIHFISQNERMSLCALKGSLTVEAALILPFFLMILLAFFSFFIQFASAADLKVKAAAEAKKVGVAVGSVGKSESADVTIYKSDNLQPLWIQPFDMEKTITERAVCRAWIGFTELEIQETYVYVTPKGSVYHLYSDCTHLNLSIQCVTLTKAHSSKNEYGEAYRACELCGEPQKAFVYITSEGDCYHSERTCSGLKRTIRQVPMSEVSGRGCCIRCMSREE